MNQTRKDSTGNTHSAPVASSEGVSIFRLLDRPIPPDQLEENTNRIAAPPNEGDLKTQSVLVFRLGQERLALPARNVDRVTHVTPVHRVPHRSGPIVVGLVNVEGELHLCGNLAVLVGVPQDGARRRDAGRDDLSRMVVLGRGGDRWAFQVDEVCGVDSIAPNQIEPPPVTVEHVVDRYTESVVVVGDRLTTLLTTDRVLSGFTAALQ